MVIKEVPIEKCNNGNRKELKEKRRIGEIRDNNKNG